MSFITAAPFALAAATPAPAVGTDDDNPRDDPAVAAAIAFRSTCNDLAGVGELEQVRAPLLARLEQARAALAAAVPTTLVGATCLVALAGEDLADGVDEDWQAPALQHAAAFLRSVAGVVDYRSSLMSSPAHFAVLEAKGTA